MKKTPPKTPSQIARDAQDEIARIADEYGVIPANLRALAIRVGLAVLEAQVLKPYLQKEHPRREGSGEAQ